MIEPRYPLQTCRAYWVAGQMLGAVSMFCFALQVLSGQYFRDDPIPDYVWEYLK